MTCDNKCWYMLIRGPLLQESTGLLVGDVLLSAACIAYYGAFPGDYRQELVSGWVDKGKEYGIPVSPDCTLRGTLASPIQVEHHQPAPPPSPLWLTPLHGLLHMLLC